MRPYASLVIAVAICSCGGDNKKKNAVREAWQAGDGPKVVYVDRVNGRTFKDESEPNDAAANAMAISEKDGIKAAIASPEDIDYYKATGSGRYLSLQLEAEDKGDFVVEVVANGAVVAKSDRGGKGIDEAISGLPVASGPLIKVSHYKVRKKGYEPQGYRLTARLGEEGTGENEPNETPKTALALALGFESKGGFGWNNDTDLWRLKLSAVSASLRYNIETRYSGRGTWRLAVLASDGKRLLERKSKEGRVASISHFALPAGESEFLVRVEGERASGEDRYTLVVKEQTLADAAEAEPNDTVAAARDANIGAPIDGMLDPDDVDVFALAAPAESWVTATVSPAVSAVEVSTDGKEWLPSNGAAASSGKVWFRLRGASDVKQRYSITFVETPVDAAASSSASTVTQ